MRKHKIQRVMGFLLVAVGIALAGCSAPGLTSAEVNRRHHRTIQNNLWQMQDDIDSILLLDRPSRLSEMTVQ